MNSRNLETDVLTRQDVFDFRRSGEPDSLSNREKAFRSQIFNSVLRTAMRVDPDSLVEDSDGLYFGVRTSTAHRIYAAATEQRKIDGVYPMGLGKTSLPILQGVLELHLEQSETPNISEPTTS